MRSATSCTKSAVASNGASAFAAAAARSSGLAATLSRKEIADIALRSVEERAIEERDEAVFVLLRAGVDAANMARPWDLPDRFGLASGLVVRRIEVAFTVLSVLAIWDGLYGWSSVLVLTIAMSAAMVFNNLFVSRASPSSPGMSSLPRSCSG